VDEERCRRACELARRKDLEQVPHALFDVVELKFRNQCNVAAWSLGPDVEIEAGGDRTPIVTDPKMPGS
jgi:hypothetical protein